MYVQVNLLYQWLILAEADVTAVIGKNFDLFSKHPSIRTWWLKNFYYIIQLMHTLFGQFSRLYFTARTDFGSQKNFVF